MSKKSHPVSQALRLIEQLTDDQKEIVRDYLRAPRKSSVKKSTASAAGSRSSRKPSTQSPPVSTVVETESAMSAGGGGD